jgi:hypothetical protein
LPSWTTGDWSTSLYYSVNPALLFPTLSPWLSQEQF